MELQKSQNQSDDAEHNSSPADTASEQPAKNEPGAPFQVGVFLKSMYALPLTSALNLMAYMAKNFNLELWYFSSRDIHPESKTVDATLIEGDVQTKRTIPFPKIVYNHFECLKNESRPEIKSFLRRNCFFVNSGIYWLGKQQVYDMLLADGQFKEFLIESHPLKDFEQLLSLLERYDNHVVVKPDGGTQGKGVVSINFNGTEYVINRKEGEAYLKNVGELQNYYDENFTSCDQLVQPYIVSRTKYGIPFDIRIHARRGAEGKFMLFPYPRIGETSENLVSNIAAGGHSMPIMKFLKNEFGSEADIIYERLTDLGSKLTEHFQSLFRRRISAMGLDVGIQRRGNSWELKLFEIQTKSPGHSAIETQVAFANLGYMRYLGEQLAQGKLLNVGKSRKHEQ